MKYRRQIGEAAKRASYIEGEGGVGGEVIGYLHAPILRCLKLYSRNFSEATMDPVPDHIGQHPLVHTLQRPSQRARAVLIDEHVAHHCRCVWLLCNCFDEPQHPIVRCAGEDDRYR